MQSVISHLQSWQPHPFVDHFTVALILLGVVVDLFGSILSARLWIRYMAVSLMLLGALSAAASDVTGGWEASRVWDAVTGPGKIVLEKHAWWGDKLPWVFAALALWRLGVQFVSVIAASRPIYLLVAILAAAAIVYQGHLGAVMVYDYGVGSALLASSQTPAPSPSPMLSTPEPSISPAPPVPLTPSPIPSAIPTAASTPAELTSPAPAIPPASETAAAPAASPSPSPAPAPSSSGSPIASPTELAPPPLSSAGSPTSPAGAATLGSPAAKDL